MKLKKKKYAPKAVIQEENQKKRSALKRELDNAYKQIDMYKRNLEELKNNETSEKADEKLVGVENKIVEVDFEIEKFMKQIQSIRNVMANQTAGMKKDRALDTVEQLKSEGEGLRIKIRDVNKEARKKEKRYM